MPGGDRTGPRGMGAMTGRAAGYCGGSGAPGFTGFGPGVGMGFGRGRGSLGRGFGGGGRGYRNRFYATGLPGWMRLVGYGAPYGYPGPYPKTDPGMEKQALKSQAEALQSELDFIKKRLEGMESGSPAD
jgi:hypothetical protein